MKGAFEYEEISELVSRYKQENISWKYTSTIINRGEKYILALQLMEMEMRLKYTREKVV